jgi:hypothetical protein
MALVSLLSMSPYVAPAVATCQSQPRKQHQQRVKDMSVVWRGVPVEKLFLLMGSKPDYRTGTTTMDMKCRYT